MNSHTTSDADRRQTPRVDVQLSATYRSANRTVDARVLNLSQSGLFLSCADSDPVGTPAHVDLALPDRDPITVSGVVIWSDVPGMGIRFGDLGRETRMALANFIMGHIASSY